MNKILVAAGMTFWWMASIVLGISVLEPIMRAISLLPGVNEDRLSWVMELIFALVTGIAQWILLVLFFKKAFWWTIATTAGMGLGLAIQFGLFLLIPLDSKIGALAWALPDPIGGILEWGILQGSMGLAQWLFLRRSIPRAGWWVVFSLVAGAAMGVAVGVGVQVPSAEVAAIPLCVGGIPGIGMALLLWGKSPQRQSLQEVGR